MKRPTMFLKRILRDVGLQLRIDVERDCQVIDSRFENEGMSFLTLTLPTLDAGLLTGFQRGQITPGDIMGFRACRRGGSLPAFLQGFFIRVFERDGSLRDEPCVESIRLIRQVARSFKKIELPCSNDRILAAYERYIANDQSILWTPCWNTFDPSLFSRVAKYLWTCLEELSGELYCFPGQFGTGATAERYKLNERVTIRKWPERSNTSFPSDWYCYNNYEVDDTCSLIGEDDEDPVRIVQVPKTLKSPRTIAVEPSYMMLMQQSVAKPLMYFLEEVYQYKSIRFTDQTHNQEMARLGSLDGSFSTIDLSDASDLVGNDLVRYVFTSCPSFLKLLMDARTRRAQLPDGSLIHLNKFASMGSALCFPIEAMIFFTIVMYSMVRQSGKPLSRSLLAEFSALSSVYGDDIIIPTEMSTGVMVDLEAFGLKVNRDKSFNTGLFRESCGGDFYCGQEVTPVYVRQWDFTGNTMDASKLSAYVSLSNQLYLKGYWHVSQEIRNDLHSRGFRIPRTTHDVGCLTYKSVFLNTDLRWDKRLSCYVARGPVLRTGTEDDPVDSMSTGLNIAFSRQYYNDAFAHYRTNILEIYNRGRGSRAAARLLDDPAETRESNARMAPFDAQFSTPWVAGGIFRSVLTTNAERFLHSVRSHSLFLKNEWCPLHIIEGIKW